MTGVVLSKGLSFVQAFAVAKALGPADFGVWVTLLLVASYGPILCLGTVEAMLKQVPFFRGRNDPDRVKETEDGVMGSIVLSAVLVVAIGIASPAFAPAVFPDIPVFLVATILVTIGISYFSAYFYHRFAAYENFRMTGFLDFFRAAAALIWIGGLGWFRGLPGAIGGYFLHELTTCVLSIVLNVRCYGKVGVSFRRVLLVSAVRIGFPITIVWWILILQNSVDRVVLGGLLGPLAVGHYGLGISITAMLAVMPMVVGRVLYPKVNMQIGLKADEGALRRLVLTPTMVLGALLANMQLLILALMPILYNELLPKYRPGLLSAQILIIGCFSACLLRNGANYLIAANKERLFLKYVFVSLVFNVVADVVAVKCGWGIEGVAVGTSAAGFLLNVLVWRRALRNLGFHRSALWSQIAALYLPQVFLGVTIAAIHVAFGGFLENIGPSSIGLTALAVFLLNAGLGWVPIYRREILSWRRILVREKGASARQSVAGAV